MQKLRPKKQATIFCGLGLSGLVAVEWGLSGLWFVEEHVA